MSERDLPDGFVDEVVSHMRLREMPKGEPEFIQCHPVQYEKWTGKKPPDDVVSVQLRKLGKHFHTHFIREGDDE